MVENKTDFQQSRNIIIAALIIGLALGINFSDAGAVSFMIGSMKVDLSGLAVASIVGIVMNAILPGRDQAFGDEPDETLASSLGKY
jgi:uracil permease